MSHPLIGLAVRVSPRPLLHSDDRSFDGIVWDQLDGNFLVMRTDDGSLGAWSPEYVRFTDPERATRMLRAHAADNEARSLGFTVAPEYIPPRWVPAKDVPVGTAYLALIESRPSTFKGADTPSVVTERLKRWGVERKAFFLIHPANMPEGT